MERTQCLCQSWYLPERWVTGQQLISTQPGQGDLEASGARFATRGQATFSLREKGWDEGLSTQEVLYLRVPHPQPLSQGERGDRRALGS